MVHRIHFRSASASNAAIGCWVTTPLTIVFVILEVLSFVGSSVQSPAIVYNITEKQSAGTIVGYLASDVGVSTITSGGNSARLVLFNNTNPYQYLFRIDISGLLRTTVVVNRDAICAGRASCVVPLDVAVLPGSFSSVTFRIVKVQVNIVDLNDWVPTFTISTQVAVYQLSESTPPGVLFPLPTAKDDDSPANGIVGYRLSPSSDTFDIEQSVLPTTSADTPLNFDVRLLLKQSLSRQRQSLYSFQLIAFDGGTPSLSGSIQIQVVIDAASDLSTPQFDSATYRAFIDDNALPGASIIRVHASSPSSVSGDGFLYAFSSRSKSIYGRLFSIDATSGLVTLSSGGGPSLSDPAYNLSVEATDSRSPNSVPGIAALIITVQYVNDQPPTITVEPMSDSGRPEVASNSPPGTFVAFLTVTDPDRGPNGQVSCSASTSGGENVFSLVSILGGYFKLLTTRWLFGGTYDLTIACEDLGVPSLSTLVNINVTVVNPIIPAFTQPVYDAHIVTGALGGGDFVIRVIANNSVATNSSMITYSLDNNIEFYIDPNDGVIRAFVGFRSSDVNRTYDLRVTAGNAYNLSSVAIVRVTVLPVSQVTYLDRAVTCGLPPTFASGYLACVLGDRDSRLSTGNTAYYAVVNVASVSNGSRVISVDPLSGALRVTGSPSAFTSGLTYQLTVKVELDTLPVKFIYVIANVVVQPSSSMTATSPRFVFPTSTNNSVFVPADSLAESGAIGGAFVAVVSAHLGGDVISSAGGPRMSYGLVQNDTDAVTYFVMSRDSGELRFRNGTIVEQVVNRTFCIFVVAFASNDPERQAVSALNIVVGWSPKASKVVMETASSQMTTDNPQAWVIIVASVIGSLFVIILVIIVAFCVVCHRRKKAKESNRKLNGETFWARVQSDTTMTGGLSEMHSPSSSVSASLEGATTLSTTPSDKDIIGAQGHRVGSFGTYAVQNTTDVFIGRQNSPSLRVDQMADDDSGCAALSNSTSSDDGNETKVTSKTSDFGGGSGDLVPLASSTPLPSATVLQNSSTYPSTVPDWLNSSVHRSPRVILTPPQTATAILRRNGSISSRKSVRFADGDLDEETPDVAGVVDPKKRVHFATEQNQYLYPRIAGPGSDVTSSAGSDIGRHADDGNSCDEHGDGASDMSFTNSDCSSGLYIVNRSNGYANNRPPILAFRTFLPPDGSLV